MVSTITAVESIARGQKNYLTLASCDCSESHVLVEPQQSGTAVAKSHLTLAERKRLEWSKETGACY